MAAFPSATKTWHTKEYAGISPTRPEVSATGKTVVVTGGGTGIGAATAQSFAQAGASHILLLGRREQPLAEHKRYLESNYPAVKVSAASTDITKKSQVESAFARSLSKDETIDVLVSNAAILGPKAGIQEVETHAFMEAVQQNLTGSLCIAQAFLPYAATDAVVVDVCSGAAHLNFDPGYTSYSVSKMSVFRLWDAFAFAHPQMSIFHLQPGVVATQLSKDVRGTEPAPDDASLPAAFMVWLASPEAQFLKGKFLWANWDVDELKARAAEIQGSSRLQIGLVGWPFHDGW